MPRSLAEAYMLILRPVPVIGEAAAPPFNGQIYIDEWNWKLSPDSSQTGTRPQSGAGAQADGQPAPNPDRSGEREAEQRPQLRSEDLRFDSTSLFNELRRVLRRYPDQPQRDRRIRETIERAAAAHQDQVTAATEGSGNGRSRDGDDPDSPGELTFGFSKNTDLATTQMLYSLANNDLIPTVILTVFQRSSRVPVTLIITMGNVRLTSCHLSCDGSGETMSEMVEKWEATYESIDYAYQNRPPVGLKTSVFAAATQGRVKVFVMKPRNG